MGHHLRHGFAASLAAACDLLAGACVSERDDDDRLGLDQAPPAVRATLERVARGQRIVGIYRTVERGAVSYLVHVRTQDGGKRLLTIAEDGGPGPRPVLRDVTSR